MQQEAKQLMKRPPIKKAFGLGILATMLITVGFWNQISEAFGPMEKDELQCLICHRERIKKWVCGAKIRDHIVTNEYSQWIDEFVPSTHDHVWITHTHYNRNHWFGGTSVGCGGIPTIPRIYEQRQSIGESESRKLALQFHQLVKQKSPEDELSRFEKALVENPASLLNPVN
ncbi:MAG: hypothetical protein NXI04_24250 [Planctomycetaceae bacterium]|nr:hypothetical protein [Planctomycetaceae bacterium]